MMREIFGRMRNSETRVDTLLPGETSRLKVNETYSQACPSSRERALPSNAGLRTSHPSTPGTLPKRSNDG